MEAEPLSPWQTGWPAMLALVALIAGLLRARRELLPPRSSLLPLLGIALLALLLRLFLVPAWARHIYDGHEADYWDIFRGLRPLDRGGTVLYPSMQWLWWSLGRVLPHAERVPVLISTLFGAASVLALGASIERLWGRRAGLLVAGFVALHPVHAAWSSSAYNVALPWLFGALALWAAASLAQPEVQRPGALGLVMGASLALVVATRLEAGLWVLPCVVLSGQGLARSPERGRWLRRVLPGALLGAALGIAALAPLLFPGEVPGAGERGLALSANLLLFSSYAPFDTAAGAALLLLCLPVALWRSPLFVGSLLAMALGNHLVLASFDDMGDRHALLALPLFAALLAGAVTAPGAPRTALLLGLAGLGLSASGLPEMASRYYASDDAWRAELEQPPWSELPRYRLAQVATAVAPLGQCGWIAEDHRVAREPALSHFNLLDPAEAESLRGPDGCLRWCADKQDWQWSSRGVRDRAARVHHLYETSPVAVVWDPDSGYGCQVWQLGARRR